MAWFVLPPPALLVACLILTRPCLSTGQAMTLKCVGFSVRAAIKKERRKY